MYNETYEKKMYMAIELSSKIWKVGFTTGFGKKMRKVNIVAGLRDPLATEKLKTAIERAKKKFRLPEDVKVVCCYEAGRDGFWIHRYLISIGIENLVADPSSFEVKRKKKNKKTDRIDLESLLKMLMRYNLGDNDTWSVVNVPSPEDEDNRHLHRELGALTKDRTRHINRISSLLAINGIKLKTDKKFLENIKEVKLCGGSSLGKNLQNRLSREYKRIELIDEQIMEIRKEQKELLSSKKKSKSINQVKQLMQLKGIGINSAWLFSMEFFSWRKFKNGKEVGSLSGLTGTPHQSGDVNKEQGISKAGNRRIRSIIIEISWIWLRCQKNSKLTKWFNERFADGSKRMRKIGIVAVARRLIVDLWRYLEYGVVPEGAIVD